MVGKFSIVATSLGLSVALAACGETQGERGLSGAATGAGAGAVVGPVTPVGPAGGALIGGAVGGATGVLTTRSQVNLGKPVSHGSRGSSGNATVHDIQAGLQRLGYNPGAADGRMGPKTAAAIRKYQEDKGLPLDGQPSQVVLDSIQAKG